MLIKQVDQGRKRAKESVSFVKSQCMSRDGEQICKSDGLCERILTPQAGYRDIRSPELNDTIVAIPAVKTCMWFYSPNVISDDSDLCHRFKSGDCDILIKH